VDQRFQEYVEDALLSFWTGREEAARRQRESGRVDAGTRGAVTAGGHLDQVAKVLVDLCLAAGAPRETVAYRGGEFRKTSLPGFYRPSKSWDIVVWDWPRPLIAIELKSQVGSFGNNANNRAEESIGNAIDLHDASEVWYDQRPWTGYAFVIEDCEDSRKPGSGRQTAPVLDPVFESASYIDRIAILCQRLAQNDRYSATWAIATSRPPDFSWNEPDPGISGFQQFADSLVSRIRTHFN
jgi:hypothetical protein